MCQTFMMDRSAGHSNVNKHYKSGAIHREELERRAAGICRKKKSSKKKKTVQKAQVQNVKRLRPVLRPTGADVPQAPQNSTQFIMDDHEESLDFKNFANFYSEEDEEYASGEYARNDFQNVYLKSHEDSLLDSSVDDLKSQIIGLETKCAKLRDAIAARPSVILDRLQNTLLYLQHENKKLKQQLIETEHSSSHTSDSSSDSDSSDSSDSDSNSDSDCSNAECKKCLAKKTKEESELESANSALQPA